jgi:hypothetical protein
MACLKIATANNILWQNCIKNIEYCALCDNHLNIFLFFTQLSYSITSQLLEQIMFWNILFCFNNKVRNLQQICLLFLTRNILFHGVVKKVLNCIERFTRLVKTKGQSYQTYHTVGQIHKYFFKSNNKLWIRKYFVMLGLIFLKFS